MNRFLFIFKRRTRNAISAYVALALFYSIITFSIMNQSHSSYPVVFSLIPILVCLAHIVYPTLLGWAIILAPLTMATLFWTGAFGYSVALQIITIYKAPEPMLALLHISLASIIFFAITVVMVQLLRSFYTYRPYPMGEKAPELDAKDNYIINIAHFKITKVRVLAAIFLAFLVFEFNMILGDPEYRDYAVCVISEKSIVDVKQDKFGDTPLTMNMIKFSQCAMQDIEIDNGDGAKEGRVRWYRCDGKDCDDGWRERF